MTMPRRVGWFAAPVVMSALTVALAAQAPRQTFRTTTRLVEVWVVVTDRLGHPVEGLTREDFSLAEDGVRQPISIFEPNDLRTPVAAAPSPAATIADEGQRTFTNRAQTANGASTVILLDRMNAGFDSQWFARKHVSRYLESMRAGDRAALYVLDGGLKVLHDFTTDRETLRRTLDQYTAKPSAYYDASMEPPAANPDGIAVWLADPTGNVAQFFSERRSFDTFAAFRYLARHLTGAPGRKSVVWISEAFTMPMREGRGEFLDRMRRAMHALSDAQVALYPVDARGLVGAFTVSGGRAGFTTFAGVRGNIETMQVLAAETGGRAYFNSNALDVSIRSAVDDTRLTYLLGYYPSDTKWNDKFRLLSVQVRKKGLVVRHRRGFYASVPASSDDAARTAALQEALQGPLQATGIGLTATAVPDDEGGLRVTVRLDPGTLLLERNAGTWTGKVDMLFGSVSGKGVGTVSALANLDITLTDQGRDKAGREGLPVERTLMLRPDTFQLRIIARDVLSGHLGSLVIPASQLKPR